MTQFAEPGLSLQIKMRNLIPFLLTALIYTNSDVLSSVSGVPTNGRVEQKAQVKDATPPTDCQTGNGQEGTGHQETKVCLDSAPAIRDMEVKKAGKLVRWKGNKYVGYYKLRDDGSIDSSHWRSSLTEELSNGTR